MQIGPTNTRFLV